MSHGYLPVPTVVKECRAPAAGTVNADQRFRASGHGLGPTPLPAAVALHTHLHKYILKRP
jgi:hypothetical protein